MTAPRHANRPSKVDDIQTYWNNPPLELSPRCKWWIEYIHKIRWSRNRRLATMGYYDASEWFGVYIWEYIHVLRELSDLYREVESV